MEEAKILIDAPAGTEIDVEFLKSLGHPVMQCNGPDGVECPIIETGSCPIAEDAHGIVFMLGAGYTLLHDGHVLMSGTADEVVRDENVRRVYLGQRFAA